MKMTSMMKKMRKKGRSRRSEGASLQCPVGKSGNLKEYFAKTTLTIQ